MMRHPATGSVAPRHWLRQLAPVSTARTLVPVVLSALLLAGNAVACFGQVDREAELEQIRGEIVRLRSRLNRVGERRNTLAEQLAATRLEVQLQEQQLAEAIAARELASERVAALEERVGTLEQQLARVRSSLRRRIAGNRPSSAVTARKSRR